MADEGTRAHALAPVDIAVVGAGVAGSVAALMLADIGFTVALVERRAPVPIVGRLGADPRTVALSPMSQHLIESVGAWPARVDEATGAAHPQPYRHMQVWDGDGGGELRFTVDDLEPSPPVLGHIVELSALTSAVWGAVMAHANVRVLAGVEVTGLTSSDDAARPRRLLFNDGAYLDTALVVAADGAASPLRHMAGGEVQRRNTGHVAIATIVAHEHPHEDTAWQVFRATGPLAFLPLPDAMVTGAEGAARRLHRSSIVWSCDAEYGDDVMQLDDAAFLSALGSAFGDRLGALLAVDARARIPLAQQQATQYQPQPGVVLVGDAAHVVHPLAGQGMNLGLRDVRVLTETLRRAKGVPSALANPRLLAEYEVRARSVNAMALGFMAGIQRLFASDHPLVRTLRSGGMRAVGRVRGVRRQLAREAMGEGVLASI